jgi:hypothetical protein
MERKHRMDDGCTERVHSIQPLAAWITELAEHLLNIAAAKV